MIIKCGNCRHEQDWNMMKPSSCDACGTPLHFPGSNDSPSWADYLLGDTPTSAEVREAIAREITESCKVLSETAERCMPPESPDVGKLLDEMSFGGVPFPQGGIPERKPKGDGYEVRAQAPEKLPHDAMRITGLASQAEAYELGRKDERACVPNTSDFARLTAELDAARAICMNLADKLTAAEHRERATCTENVALRREVEALQRKLAKR
jgi:hypothetical protein